MEGNIYDYEHHKTHIVNMSILLPTFSLIRIANTKIPNQATREWIHITYLLHASPVVVRPISRFSLSVALNNRCHAVFDI